MTRSITPKKWSPICTRGRLNSTPSLPRGRASTLTGQSLMKSRRCFAPVSWTCSSSKTWADWLGEQKLPGSVDELRTLLEEQMHGLATDSPEFGALLRKLVPDFHVFVVQRCNGGNLVPRAKIKLDLSGIAPDLQHVSGLMELLTREMTVELFQPTQRERIREEAVRLAAQGVGQREIALQIAEHPTQTAVYNALALERKMRAMGLDSPYAMVLEPPENCNKPRRHKHPRYEFQMVEGYQRPPL
jgi:hypothetical protein